MLKLWVPVQKSGETFSAILSDTSIDRDEEMMSKELLHKWAKANSLKALANHTNKMENWVGGWTNLKVVEKGKNAALFAEPWFFSGKANPLAAQIQKQVEEALERGENAGISIGAIPGDSIQKEIEGKTYKVYTEAELVEATWVPIQSNRSSTYGHIAKQFDIKESKECNLEVKKMADEEVKEVPEAPVEEAPKEEAAPVEKPAEEVKEEEAPKEEVDAQQVVEENKELKEQLKKAKEDLEAEKNKVVNLRKDVVEQPAEKKVEIVEPTVENMLKAKYGGK